MGGMTTYMRLDLSLGPKGLHQVAKFIQCQVCISLSLYLVLSACLILPSIPLLPTAVELQGTGITKKSLLRRGAA